VKDGRVTARSSPIAILIPSAPVSSCMTAQTYVIRQFDIVSVGKFFAIFGLVWGFIAGFFAAAGVSSMGTVMGFHGLGFAGGFIVLCVTTILGGIFGFIGGAIVAFIYNIVLGAIGGIEMDMDIKEKSG